MSTIDLLAWPEVDAARKRVAAAEVARAKAERQWRNAPKGLIEDRLKAFQEATHEALREGGALARLLDQAAS